MEGRAVLLLLRLLVVHLLLLLEVLLQVLLEGRGVLLRGWLGKVKFGLG